MSYEYLYGSAKINLKHLTENEKEILKKLCEMSKDLYNISLAEVISYHIDKSCIINDFLIRNLLSQICGNTLLKIIE